MSSSLSMRTSTSILSNPPWVASAAAQRIDLRQAASDARRHQVFHGASERGDLSDAARAEEAMLGRGHMNTVSMSGANFLLSDAMANSYSKSEIARRPLRITRASHLFANSTTNSLNGSTTTLS